MSSGAGSGLQRWASADEFRPVPRAGAGASFQGEFKPVPKFAGSSIRDPQRASSAPNHSASHSLQWRSSAEVAPVQQTAPAQQLTSVPSPSQVQQPVQPIAPQQHAGKVHAIAPVVIAASAPVIEPVGLHSPGAVSQRYSTPHQVRQTQFELPSPIPSASQSQPQGTSPTIEAPQPLPPALQPPAGGVRPLPDFFSDPFGDQPANGQPAPLQPAPLQAVPTQPLVPTVPDAGNGLRQPTLPETAVPQPVPLIPEADDAPMELRPSPNAPRPLELPPGADAPVRPIPQIEDFQMPRREADRRPPTPLGSSSEDISLIRPVAYSCDDFRRSIAEATIQKVSLDISPPFRPDVIEYDEFIKMKERFNEKQEVRDWQSIDGRKLGRGRLRDLAYEKVVIETEFGTIEELPVNRISESDLAYLSTQWGLPQECLIAQPQHQPRQWESSKITWKASNLMHKPLYFEEVNLERYGHTAGPILQPVVSSAHFFANIAVLPYKMGVHLPGECQYALGYYRPGNCAPWITPPVPLSLRGALFQAGAVTGAVLLIP